MTKVWAHRGASAYAPENTIPAFKLAVEMGADGVELDVQETADGRLVVIHDETVDRTSNGSGKIADMSVQQLKTLDFSNGFEQYRGARIPTLKEVYGLLRSTGLTVNVEIKTPAMSGHGIWEKCLELEREMGMTGRVFYSSFNHYALRELLACDPTASVGLLFDRVIADPWVYAQYMKAIAVHPEYRLALDCPGFMEGCIQAGIAVNPWTVNGAEEMRTLVERGASAVITNMPDVARKVIG